jgi:hypothetical protein
MRRVLSTFRKTQLDHHSVHRRIVRLEVFAELLTRRKVVGPVVLFEIGFPLWRFGCFAQRAAAVGAAFYRKAREAGRGHELLTEWFTEDVLP